CDLSAASAKPPVSVPPMGRGVAEGPGTVVAEEVVARQDVVDLQALGAGIALADVALQERVVVDDPRSLAVIEQRSARRSTARLACGWWCHLPRPREAWGATAGRILERGEYITWGMPVPRRRDG